MINKRQIAGLLAQGVGTSEIAKVAGCDDSYISQLREDDEIIALMREVTKERALADVEFDDKLANGEDKALDVIIRNIPFANPQVALATFKVLNSAVRRKQVATSDSPVNVTVNLTLPTTLLPHFVLNAQREIVEVEGKTMASATPQTIEAVLAARNGPNGNSTPRITAVERAAEKFATMGQLPVVAPRKSPLTYVADRNVTVDQL